MRAETPQEFVLLPTRGIRAHSAYSSRSQRDFLTSIDEVRTATAARRFVRNAGLRSRPDFKILDSIGEEGAKLIELTPTAAKDLQASEPGLRIVPVVFYTPAVFRQEIQGAATSAAGGPTVKTPITVLSKDDDSPIRGAEVVAFTDFDAQEGDQGNTNNQGVVKLALGGASQIERLFVYPKQGFWGAMVRNLDVAPDLQVKVRPIDLSFSDGQRHFYGSPDLNAGAGVKVGVVDTGVGPHPDLVLSGGRNHVLGEDKDAYGNNGDSHGTHVAGIIAARGTAPAGLRGIAPGVILYSYRVYGKNKPKAKNYAIVSAVDQAVSDGCDIINLSLEGTSDPALLSAIHDARQKGCLVVAAAGNGGRQPVSYPAADPLCIAVSAIGRKGTFPSGSDGDGDVAAPYGTDTDNFIAAFSNIGTQIDVCGPGVAILSTVPGGYVSMSGTSMSCPVISGFAARLLAADATTRNMARNQARSDAIASALLQAARTLGFQAKFQGRGLPT